MRSEKFLWPKMTKETHFFNSPFFFFFLLVWAMVQDLIQQRQVSEDESRELAEQLGLEDYQTSSKTGEGVAFMWTRVSAAIINQLEQ